MVFPPCAPAYASLALSFQQRLFHILHTHAHVARACASASALLHYHGTFCCNPVKEINVNFKKQFKKLSLSMMDTESHAHGSKMCSCIVQVCVVVIVWSWSPIITLHRL